MKADSAKTSSQRCGVDPAFDSPRITLCPQCGAGVATDEDGCCAMCGATVGYPSHGAALILAERDRQVLQEGWCGDHDAKQTAGQLAWAAACYAAPGPVVDPETGKDVWPWDSQSDKRHKHDRIRRLTIAGALCAAEIDRLLSGEQAGQPVIDIAKNSEKLVDATAQCPVDSVDGARFLVVPVDRERAQEWLEVFGSHVLPVTTRKPQMAHGPEGHGAFYLMAGAKELTTDDKQRLLAKVSQRFGLSMDEVAADLERYGVPLKADGLVFFEAVPRSELHRLNPEQFSTKTTEADIREWLAAEQMRLARLDPRTSDPVAAAEYRMVCATIMQFQAELNYVLEVREWSRNTAGEGQDNG